MKAKLIYTVILIPFFANAQEHKSIFDEVNIYTDVAPYQITNGSSVNKIAYSLVADYNILSYLGVGLAFNSIPGFGWIASQNARSNNLSIDLRPKYKFGKGQAFIFGQIGLPLNQLRLNAKPGDRLSPVINETKFTYSAGIGYGYKFNKYTGIQVNLKVANINGEYRYSDDHTLAWDIFVSSRDKYQYVLSVGYLF